MLTLKELQEFEDAKALMSWAHNGQYRSKSNVIYEIHPRRVAAMAAEHGFPNYIIIALLWHDCIEDGPTIIRYDIDSLINIAINQYHISDNTVNKACKVVHHLTRYPNESKSDSILRLTREGSDFAILGKVMDRIDNLKEGKDSLGESWVKKYLISSKKILQMVEFRNLTDHACYLYLKNQVQMVEGN